jgi:hypothetical protein
MSFKPFTQPADYAAHMQFCDWIIQNYTLMPQILFINKVILTRDGNTKPQKFPLMGLGKSKWNKQLILS